MRWLRDIGSCAGAGEGLSQAGLSVGHEREHGDISRRDRKEINAMCNIIGKECKICGKLLPLHLGDYDTDPEEVEMFCQDHLPCHDVRIYTLTEDDVWDDYPEDFVDTRKPIVVHPANTKFGIRALTYNARRYKDKNYPNVMADWREMDLNNHGQVVPIIKRSRADIEEEIDVLLKRISEKEDITTE